MSDLTGQQLGQYQILARIAKGSVATIYKAYQPKLDRYVAIKILSPQVVGEEEFLERFSQEARAVAQLDHPNIVPVYDFDRLGDTVYLVMKYVEGGTLKEMLVGKSPSLQLTVELVSQVGLALGYAHKRGVIHRDVKPSNILIAEGHWALLTDFGLAKIIVGDRRITRSGVGMGTPDYMSPEQAQGFPIDGRADVYSLGATLYEMVTGRVPFEAESSMAVVVKHMTEPPPPPRQFNPDLPSAVEEVILTAMEKDPDKRFQSAESMVSALVNATRSVRTAALPGVSVTARSISGVQQRGHTPVYLPSPDRVAREARQQIVETAPPSPPRGVARPPAGAREQITRSFRAVWARRVYRLAIAASVASVLMFLCAVCFVGWGLWQSLRAVPPVAHISPTPSATAAPIVTETPEPTPPPTDTPTPIPSPTPELNLIYISPDTPVRVGMYVKAVKPEGVILGTEAGFDKPHVATISQGSILYTMAGPVTANNLAWLKMRDLNTGKSGWARQDSVAAYGLPVRPTPTP